MTLDEAIKHAEEVAEEKEEQAWEAQLQEEYRICKDCAKEHRQLAEWLKELKQLRKQTKTGRWIPCSERLPEDDKKQYIVQKTNGFIDILGFTKDAYKLDKYDFAEYKGKNKQLFYKYDSEYGYIEWKCEAWQPLPEPYKEESVDNK